MSLGKLLKSLLDGRQKPAPKTASVAAQHWISNPWHAVSVLPGAQCCHKARRENGIRYLSSEAPPLPLEGCELTRCTCRYRHFDDRRTSLRRAADVWSNGRVWDGARERRRAGRRSTDSP